MTCYHTDMLPYPSRRYFSYKHATFTNTDVYLLRMAKQVQNCTIQECVKSSTVEMMMHDAISSRSTIVETHKTL